MLYDLATIGEVPASKPLSELVSDQRGLKYSKKNPKLSLILLGAGKDSHIDYSGDRDELTQILFLLQTTYA